jgi:DNA-binding LacI/PurR family transcriptional regulator
LSLTLKDIAKKAKVSIKTVSRVINDEPMVSKNTRAGVKAVIEELGYQPNLIARSLKKRKSNAIGIILPDIGNPAFTEMVKGCMDSLNSSGYYTFLGSYEDDPNKEEEFIRDFNSMFIDGLIIIPSITENRNISIFEKINCPMVFIDREIDGLNRDTVISENRNGVYRATRHLIKKGHKKIVFLGGLNTVKPAKKRFEGWKKALDEKKLFNEDLVFWGSFSIESGYLMMSQALEKLDSIDAVFAGNDIVALGAMNAIKDKNLNIPGDISIIGYDDMFFSQYLNPSLSSVAAKLFIQGKTAAELLLKRIKDPTDIKPKRIVIESDLILRDSVSK